MLSRPELLGMVLAQPADDGECSQLRLRSEPVLDRGNVRVELMAKGFAAPIWMTFKQALELGGCVRKGEKGSLVVYASSITRSEPDEATGEEQERNIPFLKSYTVFNVEQVEGLPSRYYAQAQVRPDPVERIERADAFFAATQASIRHGGNMAYHNVSADHVQMPLCVPKTLSELMT
jgi:antirestriction protein ArdC